MCDYSLHAVASRPAQAGDTIVTTGFQGTISRGFGGKDDPWTAVCLRPGTEVAFHHEPKCHGFIAVVLNYFGYGQIGSNLATFRKLHLEQPIHHDALEFANGKIVFVNSLREGQVATVLQLPVGEFGPPTNERTTTSTTNLAGV